MQPREEERRCRRGWAIAGLVLALGTSISARAETPGEKVMRLMDEAMTRAKMQRFEHETTTQEPGKAPRVMRLRVTIKGTSLRRVDFLAPGDVEGIRILIRSLTDTHVYLPAFRKTRRLASHMRKQGFVGTTLSNDDASIVTYSPVLEGKLLAETKTHWKLLGTRRPGKEYSYPRVEFMIRKDLHLATEIRYFDERGVNVKTEVRSDYRCRGPVCQPHTFTLTDHTRQGTWTKFVCKKWEVNPRIDESFFTVRGLQRSR